VEKKRLSPDEYGLVCRFIKERKNLLIGGGTGSGKSTFTNAVLKKMVEYTPNDRFYIVEDVPELQCEAKDKTMIAVNPRHAAEAVRTALRWTPDRIIFGEVRYGEVANELMKNPRASANRRFDWVLRWIGNCGPSVRLYRPGRPGPPIKAWNTGKGP
jgi:type IV secretion system protein VirB11